MSTLDILANAKISDWASVKLAPTHFNPVEESGTIIDPPLYENVSLKDVFLRAPAELNPSTASGPEGTLKNYDFASFHSPVWDKAPALGMVRPELNLKQLLAPASEKAAKEQQRLTQIARHASANRRPDGRCYNHVWRFLQAAGSYGHLLRFGIPNQYSRYARQFAEYADKNLAKLGLRRLPIDNPYLAPAGALVVVRPGAPGTGHREAGDIAVADGRGRFFNGGEMGYGGARNFPPGNKHVLGIYAPA
ncbi:MAG: hypothetical protein VKN33_04965 [Candidatus Sericytochromatia bacterium]|nr:hypothetical protein [Candidatus Sericytochromatia bacterium]